MISKKRRVPLLLQLVCTEHPVRTSHCLWPSDWVRIYVAWMCRVTDSYAGVAKRFKKQIFLSVDIPPGFLSMGDGPLLVLAAEKAVVEGLKEAEEGAL